MFIQGHTANIFLKWCISDKEIYNTFCIIFDILKYLPMRKSVERMYTHAWVNALLKVKQWHFTFILDSTVDISLPAEFCSQKSEILQWKFQISALKYPNSAPKNGNSAIDI